MPFQGNDPNIPSQLIHVWHLVVPYTRGKVLEVGSGAVRAFPHWMTLDAAKGPDGVPVASFLGDAFQALPFKDGSLNAVVASHIIDWTDDPAAALAHWWAAVKVGGHLVLHWADPHVTPPPNDPDGPPGRKVAIYPSGMDQLMAEVAAKAGQGWTLVEDERRNKGAEFSHFKVYRKDQGVACEAKPWRKPERACMVVRYGGMGDQFVASSILPQLKAQGWHVTYNGAPLSELLLRHDPHIDAFLTQDVDQVPNPMLGEYHHRLKLERYDHVIHLNESVERDVLAIPGTVKHSPTNHRARHAIMNVNYLERTHDLADLSHEFHARFYATDGEREQCAKVIEPWTRPLLLWVLKGSSIHKVWPYWHIAAARVLWRYPTATIITAGEPACQVIEEAIAASVGAYLGAAATDRLCFTSGRWSPRATMTLAQTVDVVAGPETGVLNGVCIDDVAKLIMLSHSSEENLTKHWRNTVALKPPDGSTPCYPCHMMHNDFSTCTEHAPTKSALCAANITVDAFMEGLERALGLGRAAVPVPLAQPPYIPSHLKPVEERDIMTFKRADVLVEAAE